LTKHQFDDWRRDIDAPEPSLAIFGPPAVTRLMYKLWQTEPAVKARFDLTDPLQRRDYTLWLCRHGAGLGIDRQSIAAAAAILRQATSLRRPPPRWPTQAAMRMTPADRDRETWLAEPVAWDLGAPPAGIPMPRALALLWELRQDVRLHFHNRTRAEVLDYLGWCLTQGLRDGCVAVELIEAGLAEFLDTPDPQLAQHSDADGPPMTRLLRLMAALYDGPWRDLARVSKYGRKARLALAIWACGALRRRYGWPRSFAARPLAWLLRVAPDADAFAPLDNLVLGLWELCPELRARCDLQIHEGRAALLEWFTRHGAKKFGFHAPTLPLPHKRGREGEGAVTRELCLMGYPGLASGRAEDLRMTALAFRRHGRQWAVLDRLSGAITTEDERVAAAFAEAPQVNIVHLNADTAFFDYLFLREKGVGQGYTIGYWAWELAKFPAQWSSSFAFVDEIWVASRFAYDAIAPASPKPVFLMPSPVVLPTPEPGLGRADFALPEDKFVFYFSFDLRSYVIRKNPAAAIAAFRRAFPQRAAPVILLLKTIGSEWHPDERDGLAEAIGGDPRILLIDREYPRRRAIALLALVDCFVSLHRSEGFGRGPAEAMLLGKPVITTDYSGTRDFATRETALLVDYELAPVGAEEYPGADGQVWAEPDIEAAAAAMRRIAADAALARQLGNAGRELIRRRYDPTAIGARYEERLRRIAEGSGQSLAQLATLAGRGTV
jgi:glycosyltransferase involved in cell wall biosynthesis